MSNEKPSLWSPPSPARLNRALAMKPVAWLLKDFIPAKGSGYLLGMRGCYKTGIALRIAIGTILGRAPFGEGHAPIETTGSVVYLDGHENNALLYPRIERTLNSFNATDEERERVWDQLFTMHSTALNVYRGSHVEEFVRWAEMKKPALIVFDTLMRFYAGGGYNDEDAARAIEHDILIREASGGATMWLHHPPKNRKQNSDPFRGASAFLDAADFAFEVKRPASAAAGPKTLQVSTTKLRSGPEPEPFKLIVEEHSPEGDGGYAGYLHIHAQGCGSGSVPTPAEDYEDRVMAFLRANPGAGKKEIRSGVAGKSDRLDQALERLVSIEAVRVEKGPHGALRHFLVGANGNGAAPHRTIARPEADVIALNRRKEA